MRFGGGGSRPNECVLAWCGTEAAAINGEVNAPFQVSSWNTTAARRWAAPFPCFLERLTVDIDANANTIDGADVHSRIDSVPANQIVIIDQATGQFQDLTNTDTSPNLSNIQFQYNQGDNTVGIQSCAYVCRRNI